MSTEAPPEAVAIVINGRHWDPAMTYAVDAARTDYITITAFAPLEPEQHEDLLKLGVVIQEQVDTDTYLCRYEPADLQPIRAKSYIRQADVFRSKFKIVSDLKKTVVAAANGVPILPAGVSSSDLSEDTNNITVDIMLHQGLQAGNILTELSQEAQTDPEGIKHSSRKLRLTVDCSRLKLLATNDCVRAIEEVVPMTTHNNYAREIMEADVIINDTSYHGEGQAVTVSDTGFDIGDKEKCHPAFEGRVLALRSLARTATNKTDDPIGHGTHVCGSIVGQNMTSELYKEGPIGGIAQKAKLVVQSMYYEDPINNQKMQIKTPADLTDGLFDPPYKENESRIFSNSWGEQWKDTQKSYTTNGSEEVDEFVWRTKDAVVLFSAGNDNAAAQGKPAIGAQAAAKNCITVGATGSRRKTSSTRTDSESISHQSSRGPTREGRIKPDVVAPGVNILSTWTQESYQQGLLKGSGDPHDPLFFIRTGTSMATPLVAGCCAILREVLSKHNHPYPSAALIKALIINGAVRLPDVPIEAQGFGRVNLKNSVAMLTAAHHSDDASLSPSGFREGRPLAQGEKAEFQIKIPPLDGEEAATKGTLKITLVYSDPPGVMLQNNLNLVVRTGDGREKHGNGFEGDKFDEVNNVEQVVCGGGLPYGRVVKVVVWARNITAMNGVQPFALAWSMI